MPSYLLELYVPRTASMTQASEPARFVAEQARRSGLELRYVRTLFVAEDETCFHVFETPSRDVLDEALEHAGIGDGRVTGVESTEVESAVER